MATGHYAIVDHLRSRAVLRKGVDSRKDQSYFLFSLAQEQLRRALFPLGGIDKSRIREIARQLGLKVADKEDSQEICFVPGNDYKAFLKGHLGEDRFQPGGIYDRSGRRLGDHEGIEMFTIGQRKGLPGGSPRPVYVIDIDPETRSVIVGDAEDLFVSEFEIANAVWNLPEEKSAGTFECVVKIRYAHAGAHALVERFEGGRAVVRLHTPQRAVTPGQAAVCYDADAVLGGGWIERIKP
jgi:tRNA-specific 2-thiouridylase